MTTPFHGLSTFLNAALDISSSDISYLAFESDLAYLLRPRFLFGE